MSERSQQSCNLKDDGYIWTSEYAPQAPAKNIAVVNLVDNIIGHSGSSNPDGGGLYIPVCRK
ncbi:hypothetical protein [Xenorhabdus koppenhoeferi]|uniref:hypothetical protein n=1 Tax=Xenorhabdus koppenhoeferi TaxID=351659 RepID=UPI0011604BC2|nr:hypothetical protein [Xenorhabdus koppenhoeferi]